MALIPIIVTAAKVAQKVYKHRKGIYAVLTAQDRYISNAFRYGGYGKATSYGVRSGALAGSIIGSVINESDDSPGNALPKKQSVPKTRTPYKTRRGFTTSSSRRRNCRPYSYKSSRRSRSSKYY